MNVTFLVSWFLTCMCQCEGRDGQCCGRQAQCGRRNKRNWTMTAQRTYIHLSLELIHTVVWQPVEHWAYWRPQFVEAEQYGQPSKQPPTNSKPTNQVSGNSVFWSRPDRWNWCTAPSRRALSSSSPAPEISACSARFSCGNKICTRGS